MKKPNVLLILSDQHRQDCLSVYGNKDVVSPNLDALAKDGAALENHFCPYPICTPSRYSLLTGQYASKHLGLNNYCTLPSGTETFPKVLRRGGYKTAAVGKMHFTPTYLDVGLDEMQLAEQDGPGRFEDDYHKYLKNLNLIDALDLYDQRSEYRKNAPDEYWKTYGAMKSDLPEEHHSTTWITDRACEFINDWEGGGNLLMVGFIKPHHPFDPPGKYAEMYDKNALTVLPGYTDCIPEQDRRTYHFDYENLNEDALRHAMAMYYGTITQIDDSIGRMVSLLRSKGLYDDTMIIYTSDHGDYMGFHHLLLKNGPMYDPLVKIPLIIKYPGTEQPERHQALTSTIDLPDMILKACGFETPGAMIPNSRENYVVTESFNRGPKSYMIRTETHKLLVNGSMDDIWFFDLRNDPLELHNIAHLPENKGIIDQMKAWLISEFLFSPKHAHLDLNAPAIREKDGSSQEMIDYMKERSPVKPS